MTRYGSPPGNYHFRTKRRNDQDPVQYVDLSHKQAKTERVPHVQILVWWYVRHTAGAIITPLSPSLLNFYFILFYFTVLPPSFLPPCLPSVPTSKYNKQLTTHELRFEIPDHHIPSTVRCSYPRNGLVSFPATQKEEKKNTIQCVHACALTHTRSYWCLVWVNDFPFGSKHRI
ncbi:hypothetical protein L873DRAFT_425306 [Choiromyces venosus 120613-1]|uniref:Uncharacterized protein n=1 Tax=Choiromyces venosus 120613-1 TaxID=1336337 RepID=A0A3N4JZH5_9PEZI|nr:hypothetical protein L873DRAFT_425306 [Choiromyces venosus 120613-1]